MQITKKSRNSKLKEKYYINEKTHLATEKNFYFSIPWKLMNEREGVLTSSLGKKIKN